MSLIEWIACIIVVVIAVGGLARFGEFWSVDADRLRDVPTGWAWSRVAWRAYVRAIPSIFSSVLVVVVVLPVLLIVPEKAEGPFARPLVVVVPVLAALTLSFFAVASVVLLNRPRFLVAPGLRQAPGAIAEIRGRSR